MNSFDDIKMEMELADQHQPTSAANNKHETASSTENHMGNIQKDRHSGKRGRPRKDYKGKINTTQKRHVTAVTYLTPETKQLLAKVQATMLITCGEKKYENQIIEEALELFIKHNSLKIN